MALVFQEMHTMERYTPLEVHWTTVPNSVSVDASERTEASLRAWAAYWNERGISFVGREQYYIVVDDSEPLTDYHTPSLFCQSDKL